MTTERYGIDWFSRLRRLRISLALISIPLGLIFFTSFALAQDNVIELTNADILEMIRQKVPAEVIVTRIQTSRCHFDTFPTVISELEYKGVPEEVLVAMVAAPIGRPSKRVDNEMIPPTVTSPVSPGSSRSAAPRKNAKGESVTVAKTEKSATTSDPIPPTEKAVTGVMNPTTKKPAVITPEPTEKRAAESAMRLPAEQSQQAATSQQILTNADVIKLLRSGLATGIIATTIKSAPGDYDFSAKALLELQAAGADAAVFLSMMIVSRNASSVDNNPPAAGTSESAQRQNKPPEVKSDRQTPIPD
jgi:hypothetical protein